MSNFTVLLLINVVIHLTHLSGPLSLAYHDLLLIIDSTAHYLWCTLRLCAFNQVLCRTTRANDLLSLALCCHLISLISCPSLIWIADQFLKPLLVVIYAGANNFLAIILSQHSWRYSSFVRVWISLIRWVRGIMFGWASIFSVIFRL